MPLELAEAAVVLNDLSTRATTDTRALIAAARDDPTHGLSLVTTAYPEVVGPYLAAADLVGQEFYIDQPGGSPRYTPVYAPLPDADALGANARWMVLNPDPNNTAGVLLKAVYGAFRDAQVVNSAIEHGAIEDARQLTRLANSGYETLWARRAHPGACQFCQILSTRSAVYGSARSALGVVGRGSKPRGRQEMGDKYHDHCKCMAVPVRPGARYQPEDEDPEWNQRYEAAVAYSSERRGRWDLATVAGYLETALAVDGG